MRFELRTQSNKDPLCIIEIDRRIEQRLLQEFIYSYNKGSDSELQVLQYPPIPLGLALYLRWRSLK